MSHPLDAFSVLADRGYGQTMIDDAAVTAVAAFIDTTGIAQQIADWRNKTTTVGRPATIGDRALLTVLALLVFEDSPLLISRAAELIEHRLTDRARQHLDIRTPAGPVDWYSRTWRAYKRMLDQIDPYPAPRNRLLAADEQQQVRDSRNPDTQAEMETRLWWVGNQMIDATWQLLPDNVRARWSGNIAIDSTLVKVDGKPATERSPSTVDPDAAWYRRSGDHRVVGDEKGRSKDVIEWGYESHIGIAAANNPNEPAAFPLLATAMTLDRPGVNPAGNAIAILTSMNDRGLPTGTAITDRNYWPNAAAENLQLPARALGWQNVNDYRIDQLGIQGGHAGAIQVEGDFYCPSMPQPLIDATIDVREKRITEAMWQARIDERRKYLLRPKEHPDADGHRPLMCPAVGKAATAACPLKPASQTGTKVHLRARITDPPSDPDRICTQQSVSFPPEAGAKYRQDIRFGTVRMAGHLRDVAEHDRRIERLPQRPHPPGTRRSRPATSPRTRRPTPLHRIPDRRREHPQDPRLESRTRPRHRRPPAHPTPRQPARTQATPQTTQQHPRPPTLIRHPARPPRRTRLTRQPLHPARPDPRPAVEIGAFPRPTPPRTRSTPAENDTDPSAEANGSESCRVSRTNRSGFATNPL